MGGIAVKQAIHHGAAAGVGEQLALVANQAARGSMKDEAHAPAAGGAHIPHLGFALRKFLYDDTGMALVDVDHHLLDRLEQLARVTALEQHLWSRDGNLESLAAHGLDQNAKLQLAAAG